MRHAPPTRRSTSQTGFVKPFGPHQRARCAGSVHTLNTISGGASKTRSMTSSLSAALAAGLMLAFSAMFFLLAFQFVQIIVQTVEALLPEAAIASHPIGSVLER